MEVVNMHNAKSRLSELVRKVLSGERVIIGKNNEPLVELTLYKKEKILRQPGILKGQIWASDDCWENNDDIINDFESSEIFPS